MSYYYREDDSEWFPLWFAFVGLLCLFLVGFSSAKQLEEIKQTVEIVPQQTQKKMEREYDLAFLFDKRGAKNPFADYTKVLFKLTTSCYNETSVVYGNKDVIKVKKCSEYKKFVVFRAERAKQDSIALDSKLNAQRDLDMLNGIKCK